MTYPDQVENLVAWRDQLKPQAEFWLTEIGNDVGGPIGRTERIQATKVPRAVMIALAAGVDEVMIYRESGSDPARLRLASGRQSRHGTAFPRSLGTRSKTRMRWPRRVKAIHLIELPNFREGLEELEKPLDLWVYFLQNGEQLDADALPGSLDIPEIRWAMGVLKLLRRTTWSGSCTKAG